MGIVVILFLLVGFIGLVVWASLRANSNPSLASARTKWREQAKADGFTYLYECDVAIHPDRILRIGYKDQNLDLHKKDIRSVGYNDNCTQIKIQTNLIDHPLIMLRPGYQLEDLYHRLAAMIS